MLRIRAVGAPCTVLLPHKKTKHGYGISTYLPRSTDKVTPHCPGVYCRGSEYLTDENVAQTPKGNASMKAQSSLWVLEPLGYLDPLGQSSFSKATKQLGASKRAPKYHHRPCIEPKVKIYWPLKAQIYAMELFGTSSLENWGSGKPKGPGSHERMSTRSAYAP